MDVANSLLALSVASFTGAAAWLDARTMRIPNLLTVSSFALALVFHGVNGALGSDLYFFGADGGPLGSLAGVVYSLTGFAFGFGIFFVLFAMGTAGGGDVKMIAALGSWLGWRLTMYVFIVAMGLIVLATIVMVTYRLARGGFTAVKPRKKTGRAQRRDSDGSEKRQPLRPLTRLGIPITVATWGVVVVRLVLMGSNH